jgi:hypothetical protein
MDRQERSSPLDNQVRLLDFVTVAIRHWRTIATATGLVVVLALVALLLRPRVYTTRTVLLPSETNGGGPSALASGLPAALAGGVANQDQRIAIVILRSASLVDSMVALLDGQGWAAGEVRQALTGATEVTPGDAGSVAIEVSSDDPRLAAEVAQHLPIAVNSIIANLGAQAAARKQAFLKAQIDRMEGELSESEQRLVNFQESQEAPSIDEQARRTLDVAAQLQLEIMDQEARIAALRRSTTSENPELQAAIATLSDRRQQLRRLTDGTAGPNEVLVPLQQSYELRLQASRILREYDRYQQVHASLLSNLIDSQVAAGNDLPVLSVLDAPVVPSAPRPLPLALVTVVALLLGSAIGYVIAWLKEIAATARQDPANQEFFLTWDGFRRDVRGLIPIGRKRPNPVVE